MEVHNMSIVPSCGEGTQEAINKIERDSMNPTYLPPTGPSTTSKGRGKQGKQKSTRSAKHPRTPKSK